MSQILLSEINISNLAVGMIVKNYRAMCALLGEAVKTGNAKKSQMKTWERYFRYEKVKGSQKMVITEIFEQPKEKVDKRTDGVYVKSIEVILLHELAKRKDYTATFTKNALWHRLGMVNDNYKKISTADLKTLDDCITDFEINHFYQRADSRLTGILKTALDSMQKRWVIEYTSQYRIVDCNGNRRVAEDIEILNIITLKKKVAHMLGCNDEREIFLKMKTAEFYKILNHYYFHYFNWKYVYKEYKLIFNVHVVRDEIPKVEMELQRELLNGRVANALNRGAAQNYATSSERKFKLPEMYLQAQNLLTDILIKQEGNDSDIAALRKDNEEYILTELTQDDDDELNSLFGIA